MFGKILSLPLKPVTTCGKSSTLDVWQGFEFSFVAINYFRKSAGYLFTKFDFHIHHRYYNDFAKSELGGAIN